MRSFAPQGSQDEFLSRYQELHNVASELDQVGRDVADYSRRVQTAAAETTNSVLGILAVVGLPLTLAVAIWQGTGALSLRSVTPYLLGSVVLAVVMLVVHPGGRALWVRLWRGFRTRGRR